MSSSPVVGACLFAILLAGCEGPHKVPISERLEEEPDPAPRARASATSSPTLADSAAPVAEKPVERFTEPPQTSTRRTLAHILEPKARVGAYLGLPDGWRNDDPSYLLFFPRGNEKPPARAVALTLVEPGLSAANQARALARGSEPTGLKEATWSSWTLERVGVERFEANVAIGQGRSVRGSEGPRRALAAVIDIPGAPALGFVGSWAASEPSYEAVIVDMLRAVERCRVDVGRGCVTAQERKHAAL